MKNKVGERHVPKITNAHISVLSPYGGKFTPVIFQLFILQFGDKNEEYIGENCIHNI